MPAIFGLTLPSGVFQPRAVIFDMDGVLSDTQSLHAEHESAVLREHGIELSPEAITREFAGVTDEQMFPAIFRRAGKPLPDLAAIYAQKWERLMAAARGRIRPIPGTLEFFNAAAAAGLPLGVASSSRRVFVEIVLDELGIRSRFAAVVTSDDVARSKPDPAIYLLAAERLSTPPAGCLVIEDSSNGVLAAKRAGMVCIALVSPEISHHGSPADVVLTDLRALVRERVE